MILLGFTVRNHRSVRDEVIFDLSRPWLRTLQPRNGDWESVAYPLAGIFGGNATGKSALLDALIYTFSAIQLSAATWQASKSMRRSPFMLDGTAPTSSSEYEIDFVYEDRRHLYGFEVDVDGIKREWLRDVPRSRWRTLLDRDRDEDTCVLHPSLRMKSEVTGRELVLSRAFLLPGSPLHDLAQDLVTGFGFRLVTDSRREARLTSIADSPADGSVTVTDLEVLAQVADICVGRGESDGTSAWLAVAVPALEALRGGGLLVVDEIDASLHPHLLDVLLGVFADSAVNTKQAQLIFTSHESYVLSRLSEVNLEPGQVWFVDKTYEGVTELTCLADFPKHPDANVAKSYLTGRYGGTPRLSPSSLAALVGTKES